MELHQIEIKDGDTIPFIEYTQRLGRAEFIICPVYKYGCLNEVFIYRKQQEEIKDFYHWKSLGRVKRELNFSSFDGLSDAKIWRTFFCKEHKTNSIELYVPIESSKILFHVYSFCVSITFRK